MGQRFTYALVPVWLLQNSGRPDSGSDSDPDSDSDPGAVQMQTGHGNTRFGGADIPVCPNAMTKQ
jgi:hypothetical protein